MARRYSAERISAKGMKPNMPSGNLMEEDWSKPALLPRGVHEKTVGSMRLGHASGRIGDLNEQVDKTMKEDASIFDRLTRPTNW